MLLLKGMFFFLHSLIHNAKEDSILTKWIVVIIDIFLALPQKLTDRHIVLLYVVYGAFADNIVTYFLLSLNTPRDDRFSWSDITFFMGLRFTAITARNFRNV